MKKILNYIENIPIFLQVSWLNGGLHSPVFCVPLLLVSLWVSIVMCCVQTATDYSVLELGELSITIWDTQSPRVNTHSGA